MKKKAIDKKKRESDEEWVKTIIGRAFLSCWNAIKLDRYETLRWQRGTMVALSTSLDLLISSSKTCSFESTDPDRPAADCIDSMIHPHDPPIKLIITTPLPACYRACWLTLNAIVKWYTLVRDRHDEEDWPRRDQIDEKISLDTRISRLTRFHSVDISIFAKLYWIGRMTASSSVIQVCSFERIEFWTTASKN